MKSIMMKAEESKSNGVSLSKTPSRTRVYASPKSKNLPKPEIDGVSASVSPSPKARRAISVPPRDSSHNSNSSQKIIRRSTLNNRPKSGEEPVLVVGSQKSREVEQIKPINRSVNRAVIESYARPIRHQPADLKHLKKKNEVELVDEKKELQEKLEQNEGLIKELKSEILELKSELGKTQNLNVELQSQNKKLSEDLASADAKITSLTTSKQEWESVAEYPSSKFKDIQKLIANKLENSPTKKDLLHEKSTRNLPATTTESHVDVHRKVTECPSAPPPPPPLPPRRSAKAAASTRKASPVVELYNSLATNKGRDSLVVQNYNKQIASSAHNSIVGEIQNRSAHLLAIKADIETKGEFVNGLIHKVLIAAYPDIEDVLTFVDWLDNELSSLADEQAVLRHFKWPEKKADAMREAAIEYRSLKLLKTEVSSYKDDTDVPCGVALKKMAGLLDKSERSIQRLIKLRNSVMRTYQDHKIPTDWMLDSGIVTKIKEASRMLAKLYVKRVALELESFRYSEWESTQEALLLQGVHFAYRAHQFSGGLDSDTLCAFEEIRQRVPGHMLGSQELIAAIPSS